jgi:competence protein ComEA
MSHPENSALLRVAVVLLLASGARVVWSPEAGPLQPGGDNVLPELLEATRGEAAEAEARARPLAPGERLDANRATAVELDRLPGVGPATAEAWIAARDAGGPFRTADDLLRVRGLGPALLARIRGHVDFGEAASGPVARSARPAPSARAAGTERVEVPSVAGSRPSLVDVNRADTTALQALPGVGPALARRIVETRNEAPFRTVDELVRVRGIGPATLARLRAFVSVGR